MEKLKQLREERGLSQVKLAARADLNPATVNQIERGMRDASPGTLRKLADALEVSLYELLEEEVPKVQAPLPLEDSEQRRFVPEALNSYMSRRATSLEAELKDKNSPHFKNATTATVWVAGVQREAKDWADWAAEEWSVLMPQGGGLFDAGTWRDALNIMGHLLTFQAITRKAERRIATMADQPDDLAQKRLEKDRREAQESERRLQELRAASG
jgi:transcriptional regulator with XRE-family HTH domain